MYDNGITQTPFLRLEETMDIHTQVRIIFGILSGFLFITAILHHIFPTWRIFCNRHARELLGEQEGLIYEKRSSLSLMILGFFMACGAISPAYFHEKSLMLFTCIGAFLGLFYQACLNYKYFGTINGPHMIQKKKYFGLRCLIYTLFLIALTAFLFPCEGMNPFVKCLLLALAAGAGSRIILGS